MVEFQKRSTVEVSANELFAWHSRAGAFQRLVPPWDNVLLEVDEGGIQDGARKVIAMQMGPLKLRWHAHHHGYMEGEQFCDTQVKGPFARWLHTHRFVPSCDKTSVLQDHIDYRLPLHPLSQWIAGGIVKRMLQRMFDYRHEVTQNDLKRHAAFREHGPQRVAITGASGLVGTALTAFLRTGGHEVVPLVRRRPSSGEEAIFWKPSEGSIDAEALEGFDVVIHLAGAGVADRRWSDKQKALVKDSRVNGTRLLSNTLARLRKPPRALLSGSAVGIYGHTAGEERLNEESPAGDDFLVDVCKAWEAETRPAEEAGIRVVHMRIGLVMAAAGGVLGKMLLPFKMGTGGRIGSGQQGMSWISIDDTIAAMHYLMFQDDLSGPVNLTAPNPVSNATFTKTLGKVLKRPTFFPLPAMVVKTIFGEMGEVALLGGAFVEPSRLLEHGFEFFYPSLEDTLRHQLGRE